MFFKQIYSRKIDPKSRKGYVENIFYNIYILKYILLFIFSSAYFMFAAMLIISEMLLISKSAPELPFSAGDSSPYLAYTV